MKTRERLAALRQAKTWGGRETLAKDYWPGTPFDAQFEYMTWHLAEARRLRSAGKPPAYHSEVLREFGESVVEAIAKRDSQTLHELADAVEAWKNHKPEPDKLRKEINLFFAEQQQLFWRNGGQSPKVQAVSMRELLAHLCKKRIAENTEGWRRHLREVCKKMNLPIAGNPGAPKKTGGKTQSKNSR